MNSALSSLFKTFRNLTLALLLSSQVQGQVMGYYHKDQPQSDETIALTQTTTATTDDAGIDFKEWDQDFDKSIDKAEKQPCKGKNCKFKMRQALDSSFDF